MSRICNVCGDPTNQDTLYRKCQPCFERGQFGERQTGRTCAQLKLMMKERNAVYVFPLLIMAHHLHMAYPELEKQITTVYSLPRYLRGKKGVHVFFDHTVHEMLNAWELGEAMTAIAQTGSHTHL